MKELEKTIDYKFKNGRLLQIAMTHSSFANEAKNSGETKKRIQNNERQEFLGDAVLSIIVSDYIYEHFIHLPEGELTKVRASLVCEKSLCSFAREIDLGGYLRLGKGEELMGGRNRPSILADAFEALIAAIYLDGGMESAQKFVLSFVERALDDESIPFTDYKTLLQEVIQQNKEEKLRYVLVQETGPDHDKRFEVEVHLNSNVIGTGTGRSKKDAEQRAAKEAMKLMGL